MMFSAVPGMIFVDGIALSKSRQFIPDGVRVSWHLLSNLHKLNKLATAEVMRVLFGT